jgi:hypothetical protein
MADEDMREQIAQLELHIERLAGVAERCRKFMLAARISIALGGAVLISLLLRFLSFDPVTMVVGITATIGGIVLLGSNASTLKLTEATMQNAEALRAELIGRLELQVVLDRMER